MIKVLIATGIYPPDIGGPATYVKTLQTELPKFGYKIKVVTYSDSLDKENEVYKISRRQNILLRYWYYFSAVYKLAAWADIIYAQGPVGDGLPTWLACKLKNKKYFLKVVGDYAWEQGKQRFGVKELLDDFQTKKYGIKVELIRFLQRLVARNAILVITPSEYLKRIVSQWGVDVENIKVIYNSVAKIEFGDDREKLRNQFGFKENVICSVGRLQKWKGFDVLIEIMPALLKINPNFKLFIFGSGPEEPDLQKIINRLNLHKNVKLMGSQPHAELMQYMSASDYFVLNTGYEGLPHLVIEAMQLGLPVITTNIGGNPEVVKNGVNGVLVEYNNKEQIISAIKEMWQNIDKGKKIVDSAKNTSANFNKEKMISELVNTFEKK